VGDRNEGVDPQLLKGTTPMLILAVIDDGELYGYEIAQRLRDRSGGTFEVSEGSLYPTLHRLELDGALTATWRASDRGPRRRYYRLTEKGEGLLSDTRARWGAFVRIVDRVASPG
jgi:PadR family transcriptional regulator, regulatory protein PadR